MKTGYLIINDKECKIKDGQDCLTLAELQNIVGTEGAPAYIEAIYQVFSDKTIVIMVDEEGRLKRLSVSFIMGNLTLVGQVIVGRFRYTEGEDQFKPLTAKQIEIVLKETGLTI
jgi:Domain of unknown function (DUF3846)